MGRGEGGTILRLITPTCNGAFNPSAAGFGRGGGDSSISIPVVNGCQLQPVSEAPWIALTSRNDGPEFVRLNYSVATNRKIDRVGSIRAYGRRFWIGQIAGTGCVYTSDRNEDSFGANGGTGTVSLIAASDCPWISRSYASWLTITSGASGKSNGTVTFSVAPNPGAARTGIMIIAGGTFTVQQAGAPANAPPIARIQYGVSGGTLVNAPATPVTLPMAGAPLSVTLDGGQSSDPEASALSYSWTRDTTGMTAGSVNSSGANLPTYNLTFSSNARGTVVVNLTVKDQSNLQHTASITFNLVTANQPPVVHIKYRVDSGTLVDAPSTAVLVDTYVARTITLDGSASADPEGGAISFSWSKGQSLTRGAAALTGQTTSTATLSIDAGTDGTVTVFLAVTETTGAQTSAAIVFRVAQRPTAVIATRVGSTVLTDPVHLEPGASAILDGTGSRCSDGSAEYLNYSWRQTSGIPVTLNDPESATTSFVVPSVEAGGAVLTFELTVTDWRSSLAASSAKNLTVDAAPLYFSQVGVGPVGEEELRTVLLFVNNSTQRATNVVLELFDQQGHPLQASVNQQPWSSTPFEIPAFGSKRLDLTSDQVQVGWARVRSNVKLGALALFQVINPASLASRQEASILPSVRGRRFTAYLDVAQETAVAVANPGDLPAIVSVKFKDGTGSSVASLLFPDLPGGRLGPKAHNARFIDGSLLSQLPATFRQGSMVIESDQDVIVTGLKTKSGFVLSSLAMTGDEGMNTTNYFAQLGVGPIGTDELRTVLLLVNNGVSAATGVRVSLLNEQGTPLQATVGGQPWSAVPFDIQGNFARALDFSSNSVQVGWAQVDSNEPVGGLVLFQIVNSATQELLREASILPSAKSKRFATYFNRSDETALAVANPGDLPALVRLKLIDYVNGVQRIVVDTPLFPELSGLTLGAKGHSAKFITPSLLGDLPANFSEGTLVIESDRDVTMVVLRTKAGVVLSALPLAAAP